MSYDQVVVLATLAAALVLFITEWVPVGVTGLGIIAVFGLTGVLSGDGALAAFASPAVVLVGSLYVVSASLIRTGVLAALDRRLLLLGQGGSELRLLVWSTLAALFGSTVLNNTSVVVILLPVLLGVSQRLDIAPSRLLMPISFAAILGGTMTLIGTSTNILVASLAEDAFEIRFFDFLPMGAGYALVGLTYLWFAGRHLLPARQTVTSITRGRGFEYVCDLRVPDAGPSVGRTPREVAKLVGDQVRLLQLIRGEAAVGPLEDTDPLRPGDVLVLRGPPEAIVSLRRDLRLDTVPSLPEDAEPPRHATTFAEVLVTPGSEFLGRTLEQARLYRSFRVIAVALQRRGAHLRHGIVHVPLRVGDVVLVQGRPEDVEKLRGQPGLLLLVGVEEHVVLRRRAPVALAILLLFVAIGALGLVDLPLLAVGAAVAALATGCIRLRRAILEVDWNILGLLAGSVTLGAALDASGIAAAVADLVVAATSEFGPVVVLSAFYLITSVTTEFVSNAGAAALMTPIALATAQQLDVSPRPFVFAVAFAASASFCTPIGYQTNTVVYGPGGYRFGDFLRVGLPLQLLLWVFATVMLPVFFPFEG